MSATQAEVFSTHNISVLIGLLLLAVMLGEVVVGPHPGSDEMAAPVDTMEDIAMRIKPVVSLQAMQDSKMGAPVVDSADMTPDQLYDGACLACHTSGAAGAPKIGDAAAWSARAGKGLDAMVSSAINGIGAMPPRGGSQYDDGQMQAVVEYILDKSQ